VSGGSVIGALYASTDGPFPEFESRVRTMLARGLSLPAVRTAALTTEGTKAFLCATLTDSINLAFITVSSLLWGIGPAALTEHRKKFLIENWHPPVRRFASFRHELGMDRSAEPSRRAAHKGADRRARSRTCGIIDYRPALVCRMQEWRWFRSREMRTEPASAAFEHNVRTPPENGLHSHSRLSTHAHFTRIGGISGLT